MLALEPELVLECISLLDKSSPHDSMGLHERTVTFSAEQRKQIVAVMPLMEYVCYKYTVQKMGVPLIAVLLHLSAVNWGEAAAEKYIKLLRGVLGTTQRLKTVMDMFGGEHILDPCQQFIVRREDILGRLNPDGSKAGMFNHPLQFAVSASSAALRPKVVKALLDTGAYSHRDPRCTTNVRLDYVLCDAVDDSCAATVRHLLDAGMYPQRASDGTSAPHDRVYGGAGVRGKSRDAGCRGRQDRVAGQQGPDAASGLLLHRRRLHYRI